MSETHPICREILSELRTEDGQLSLPQDGLRRIETRIDALADDPSLVFAVRSVLALAAHLELDRGAKAPAHALMHLVAVRTPGALSRQIKGAQGRIENRVNAVRSAFSRLSASDSRRCAPRVGARAPHGAVGLAALVGARQDFDPARALAERRARMGR